MPVGRVRYSSSEITVNSDGENVPVFVEPTDMLARRTALFGMSRSGKSNTIKTLSSAIFDLRKIDPRKGRIGQLIFDVNGEYANDNPQDEGCLRNIDQTDVVTYGLFKHPKYDENRRLIKLNFFGTNITDWTDRELVRNSLDMLYAGKEIIDEHLQGRTGAQYIRNFTSTNIQPTSDAWGRGEQTRYRRNITVFRAILAAANFEVPADLTPAYIAGLFPQELRRALRQAGDAHFTSAADTLDNERVPWIQLFQALSDLQEFIIGGTRGVGHPDFQSFNNSYQARSVRSSPRTWCKSASS